MMSGYSFPAPSNNPQPMALRRLQRDFQKMLEDPVPGIHALPTEANILEWHYVIEGSLDTDYSGGYYHGKIVFQSDYPWKPPAICMITPNGRFRTNMRLCLSISDYHPESWNPGWNVSAILVGLHSFMNEEAYAAGVENMPRDMRRRLALDSIRYNLNNPEFMRMFPHLASIMESVQVSRLPPPPASPPPATSSLTEAPPPRSPSPQPRRQMLPPLIPAEMLIPPQMATARKRPVPQEQAQLDDHPTPNKRGAQSPSRRT